MKPSLSLLAVVLMLASVRGQSPPNVVATPVSGRIAFSSFRNGINEIYVMDADGSNPIRLTTNAIQPAWSPDGRKIAFASVREGDANYEIYVMDANGSNVARLTHDGKNELFPAWSPDGTKIAFTKSDEGKIYTINADGSNQICLTSDLGSSGRPKWAPDGTKIVFLSSDSDSNFQVHVMDADGSHDTRLTNGRGVNNPAWSPDGMKIAFSQSDDNNIGIYVMDADGSDPIRLVNLPSSQQPAWSPDGSKIAFISDPEGGDMNTGFEIYVMNADGTNPTRLTSNNVGDFDPAWEPTQRIPLVFIPGIAGSMLTGNGETGANGNHEYLWPTLGAQDIRAMNLHSSVSDIQAVGIVREYDPGLAGIGKVIAYGPLMDYLVNALGFREFDFAEHPERMTDNYLLQQNWPEKPTLFTFPYDWRQTNSSHVDRLHEYITEIRQLHGGAKVDVIAHSMGGILLREYMLRPGYASDINKVITIGTPCWGSPKTLYRMLTGKFYPNKIVDWINSAEMKSALRSMPSTAELLPPFQDGHISERSILLAEDGWDLNGENGKREIYSPTVFWKYIDGIAPGFQTINTNLHSAAQDDWHGDSPDIPYLQVSGLVTKNGQPTTASDVVAFEKNWSVLGITIRQVHGFRENEQTMAPGDNVVPFQSADRPGQYLAPNTTFLRIPGDSEDPETNPAEHLELTKHPQVHANIAAFLGLTPHTGGSAFSAPVSPRLESGSRRSVTIFGTGYVPISDSAGNRNTQLTDVAIQKIPGLNIEYHAEEGWIEIEGDTSKEFTITNPAVTAELEAQIITYNSAGTSNSLTRYRFAPSAESWQLSALSGTSHLAVDANKNGVFEADEMIIPSHQVTGSVDTTAPTIDASYSQTTGSVVVTLTAHDDVTANPAVRYTIDGGPVQTYQTPLSFPSNGNAALKAFAEDAMGNTSALLTTTVPPPGPIPTATPGLVGNVSTRLSVGTGDDALIEGFIVEGTQGSAKKIMVRALGPSLTGFGVADALANPILEIHDSGGATVATNNDWRNTQTGGLITADQSTEMSSSGLAPGNDLESAIIANLEPGSYTAVVRGFGNSTGTGVVDAYDLSGLSPARLANIATRGLVQAGDKLMIAGFIVQNGPVKVVIRAIGPSLSAFGITNALADTTLQLRDLNGAIVRENDNWKTDQKSELENIGLQPTDDLEAALVETIPPGQYTAQIRGKNDSSGIGVVQVYFLQ